MAGRLTDRGFWDASRSGFVPTRIRGTPFDKVLHRYLPRGGQRSIVEIGAYPGGYLLAMARDLDLRPTAIDYTEHAQDIARLFAYNGLAAPEILNEDFFEVQVAPFDVVTSFGFVEHFEDLGPVMDRHVDMVSEGGHLVISVPYIGGWQGLLRRLVYTDHALRAMLTSHNTATMQLAALRREIENRGLQVVFGNYVMKGYVWIDPNSPSVRQGAAWLVKVARLLNRALFRWLPSTRLWSPMILVIAKKP